jgi:hypothetical protein
MDGTPVEGLLDMTRRIRTAAAAAALMFALELAAPPAARAQVFTGRVDISIEDPTGARLPGATVDLTGPVSQTQVADSQGQAHFLNLPVGIYTVKTSLPGFTPSTSNNVEVLSGSSTPLAVRMDVAGATETIDVTAISPAVDLKRATTTTHVTAEELQNLPAARDPWVVMQTVPTVYMDRVNVGGSESGQQSNYNAKGAQATDNAWSIDGVPVTDMGDSIVRPEHAAGSSAFYYDFDSFQEMAITTGGADAQNATPGVQLSMVLKKGLNAPHGGLRYYFENETLQDVNISPELAAALGNASGKGNRTDKYQDYGFDLGGPLLEKVVWIWGSMSKTGIDLLTLNGESDNTSFTNYALKVDGKLNDQVRGNFTFYENNKTKTGRDAGPTRPPETTWDQAGPSRLYKGEGTFAAGRNFFASVKGAFIDAGFTLIPVGGLNTDYYIDDGGVAHNTYYQYQSTRPQHYVGGDASYFQGTHELKFGGGWRKTPVQTQQTWPASHFVSNWETYPNMLVQVARDYQANTDAEYISGYVTDTISLARLTLTGGVRFDRQSSSLAASSVPGVAGFETILPAVSTPAISNVFVWNKLTPRVGFTVAVDQARKTIVRGSYAMFASQLPAAQAAFVSPIQYSYAYYNAVDRNGDGVAQLSEILVNQGLQGYAGFDPKNPKAAVNTVAAGSRPQVTHEFLAGFDKELTPHFSVSGTVTYRRMVDSSWTPLAGVTQANYSQTATLTGSAPEIGAFSVPLYALNPAAVPPGGGKVYAVREGYHQRYLGFELSASKRLSNRWMARVGFSNNDWREYFDDPSKSILDPTRAPAPSPAWPFAGPQVDGGTVLRSSTGSGKSGIYMVAPSYQFIANGLFEAIWGVSIGANLVARQGYAEPFFQSNVPTGDPLGHKTVLLVTHVDDFRLPAVTSFDGRVEKKFVFGGATLAVDFDVFNLLNAGTILGKQYDTRLTGPTGFGSTLEIMNPRIARIGVRFLF